MPFARPTLTQLRTRIVSNIVSFTGPLLRFSNLGVIGAVLAGLSNGFYGYLDYIAQQAMPFTATGVFLEAWAALKGVIRKPATAAGAAGTSLVQFAGAAGGQIPIGTPIVRLTDGFSYTATAAATVAANATSVTVSIVASSTGSDGDAAQGTAFVLGEACPGIQSTGAASTPIIGGADLETDDELRTRMLQAYAAPAQGGAFTDYIEWAEDVPGVTRAWVKPNGYGAGTIVVYVMLDEAEAANGGFPQGLNGLAAAETRPGGVAAGDQLAVANALFLVQPATALVFVCAPMANVVNFTIAGLATAGASAQAAVAAAISQVFLEEGSVGGVLMPDLSASGVVDVEDIETAIAALSGTRGFVITAIAPENGMASPGAAGNITSNPGYLPTLGAIVWV